MSKFTKLIKVCISYRTAMLVGFFHFIQCILTAAGIKILNISISAHFQVIYFIQYAFEHSIPVFSFGSSISRASCKSRLHARNLLLVTHGQVFHMDHKFRLTAERVFPFLKRSYLKTLPFFDLPWPTI